jgi:hypothetical protein
LLHGSLFGYAEGEEKKRRFTGAACRLACLTFVTISAAFDGNCLLVRAFGIDAETPFDRLQIHPVR